MQYLPTPLSIEDTLLEDRTEVVAAEEDWGLAFNEEYEEAASANGCSWDCRVKGDGEFAPASILTAGISDRFWSKMQTHLELAWFAKPIISPIKGQRSIEAEIKECITHCLNIRVHRRKPYSVPIYITGHQTHEMECFVTQFIVASVFGCCYLHGKETATIYGVRWNDLANKRNTGIVWEVFFIVVDGNRTARTPVVCWIWKNGE